MQQQNPGVDNAVTSLVTSLTFPMLYGDERDAIIAKWNQLQASLGTGKVYYHRKVSSVELLPENSFCLKNNSYCADSNQEKSNLWGTVKESVVAVSDNKFVRYGAAAGVAMIAAPVLVSAVGFGSGGIAAGSAAAGFQSAWFGGTISGVTGCMFSGLQSIGAAGLAVPGKVVVAGTGCAAIQFYDTIKGKSQEDKTVESEVSAVQSARLGEMISGITDQMVFGMQSIGAAGLGVAGKAVAGTGTAAAGIYDVFKGKSKDDKTTESEVTGVQSAWFGEAVSGITAQMASGMQNIGAAGLGVAGKAVAGTGTAAAGIYDVFKGKSKDDKTTESEVTGVQSAWFGETVSGITAQMASGMQNIGAAGLGVAGKAVAGTGTAAAGIYDVFKGKSKDDKTTESEVTGVQSAWFGETVSGITAQMASGMQNIGAAGLGVAGKAVAGTGTAAAGIYDVFKGKSKDDKTTESEVTGVQSAWFGETVSGITAQMASGMQNIGAAGLGVAGKAVAGTGTAAAGIYDVFKGKSKDDKTTESEVTGVQSAWFGEAVSGITAQMASGMQNIGAAGLGVAGKAVTGTGTAAFRIYDMLKGKPKDDTDSQM